MASARVVVITGCSTGIGLSTAVLLAQNGFKVYATMRNLEKKTSLEEQGKEWLNTSLFIEQLDVCSDESVEQCFKKILEKEGRVDVLVNNAGVGMFGPLEVQTMDEWKSLMETNFFGVLRTIQAVLPVMKKNKSGHMFNISSQVGLTGFLMAAIYSASKFAMAGLSESLAVECKQFDINVSLIEPGPVTDTAFGSNLARMAGTNEPRPVDQETMILCNKATETYRNTRDMHSQTSSQIAEVILEALVAESPHFRYPTSHFFRETNEKIYVDTTGDSNIAMMSARYFPAAGQN